MKKKLTKENLLQLISTNDSTIAFIQKPKQSDSTSKIWNYFSIIHGNNVKQNYVFCNACKSIISYKIVTGTGGMQKHIASCGKISKNRVEQKEAKITQYFNSSKTKAKAVSIKQKNKITNALAEFVVIDGRPFETVNGLDFTNLIECVLTTGRTLLESSNVNANDLTADSRTISRNIDKMYEKRKSQLITLCKSIRSFVITIDFWSERFTENQIMTMWIPQDEHYLASILHPNVKQFDKNPYDKTSNTTVERIFSISKNLITDKRTRLGTEKVNQMIFLRKNLITHKDLFNHDHYKHELESNHDKRKNDDAPAESLDKNSKNRK
ncbi:unnamed protein product [Rotaria socialis]